MPRSSKKKTTPDREKKAKSEADDKSEAEVEPTSEQSPYDPDSVIDVKYITSPKGHTYRIVVTDEMDPYDKPKPPARKRHK